MTEYCCYGYCIDLLRRLASRGSGGNGSVAFTYSLHLVGDGQMGGEEGAASHSYTTTSLAPSISLLSGADKAGANGTSSGGIVGELVAGLADLSVAPMTITPERVTRVEFTKPFKYLGITMLIKRVGCAGG